MVTIEKVVENWWNGLDYDLKVEIMAYEFPDEAHLIEADDQWSWLDFDEKYEIYRNSGDKDELTDDEKLMNKGDWEYHEMIEREGRVE